MIEHNWENFLKNLGEWQGSFTSVANTGELGESTPSLLTLVGTEDNQVVHFRLQRFGPEGYGSTPISDISQTYQTLGKQTIFLQRGPFLKGPFSSRPMASSGPSMALLRAIAACGLSNSTIARAKSVTKC